MAVSGRGNGLRAESYVQLAELDPRVADTMLELLADTGIAAYAVPVGSELSGHFGTHLPQRPTDRLYVDAGAVDPARSVLRSHLPAQDIELESSTDLTTGAPGSSDPSDAAEGFPGDSSAGTPDDDAAWQQIIAAFNSEPPGPVPPWPASEDLDREDTEDRDEDDESDARRGSRVAAAGATADDDGDAGARSDADSAGSEDEDHFVPPPPPPLPRPDPVTAVSWACLFGGPGYLLIGTMLGWSIPAWAAFTAVAAFVGGFVTLVVRMGDDPPPDSGPDDGAIV